MTVVGVSLYYIGQAYLPMMERTYSDLCLILRKNFLIIQPLSAIDFLRLVREWSISHAYRANI